jgi:hypothetical protein
LFLLILEFYINLSSMIYSDSPAISTRNDVSCRKPNYSNCYEGGRLVFLTTSSVRRSEALPELSVALSRRSDIVVVVEVHSSTGNFQASQLQLKEQQSASSISVLALWTKRTKHLAAHRVLRYLRFQLWQVFHGI